MQSRANERYRDQIFEEIKEKHDLSRYQNESDEARRLQNSENLRRVRKGLDLQHPASSESCRSSMTDYDEEMALEPPRKRPECPECKEARGREEYAWRLEPQGETEVPETVIVADEVEGTYVDSNGEGHHGRGKVKNHRSQSGVPGGEGEEIKSPRRKVIRVESEEMQDYVKRSKEHGSGRSGRTEFSTECDQCSAKDDITLR